MEQSSIKLSVPPSIQDNSMTMIFDNPAKFKLHPLTDKNY